MKALGLISNCIIKGLANTSCPRLLDCTYTVTITTGNYPTKPNIFEHELPKCSIRKDLKMVRNLLLWLRD